MIAPRNRLLVFQLVVLCCALVHLLTLTLPGRNPALFWAPVLIVALSVVFKYRTTMIRSLLAWRTITIAVLITATISDHLLNFVPYEPDPQIQASYRLFQLVVLFVFPLVALITSIRSRSFRIALVAGLMVQLLPPYSYGIMTQFLTPSYGRITIILYLVMLLPVSRIRLPVWTTTSIILLPSVSLPALFYAHSPGNTADHIIVMVLLIGGAFAVSAVTDRQRSVLMILVVSSLFLQMLFSLLSPGLHAVNSNVTAMASEWAMVLAFHLLMRNRPVRGEIAAGVLVFLLTFSMMLRIESTTGTIVTVIATGIFAYMRFIHPKLGRSLRSAVLPLTLTVVVIAALWYLLTVPDSYSIQTRRLLWEAALKGFSQSALTILTGTGDFGPYHFFLFRHLGRSLDPDEAALLQTDPWLVGHHPHNDYILMLYGGGLVFFSVTLYLFIRTLLSSLRTKRGACEMAAAMIGIFLIHGLTEPLTTSPATGFLFFAALSFYWQSKNKWRLPLLMPAALSILAIFLLVIACLQIPVIQFWKHHSVQAMQLQAGIAPDPLPDSRVSAAVLISDRLSVLTRLNPLESDLFRQKGDIETILSISEEPNRDQHRIAAMESYCRAFALRSSPVHAQNLKNLHQYLPGRELPCSGRPYREILEEYDPWHLTHFIQTVPDQ